MTELETTYLQPMWGFWASILQALISTVHKRELKLRGTGTCSWSHSQEVLGLWSNSTLARALSARFTQQTCFQSAYYVPGLSFTLGIQKDKVEEGQLQCSIIISVVEQASPRRPMCMAGVNVVVVMGHMKLWVSWRAFQQGLGWTQDRVFMSLSVTRTMCPR